MIASETTSSHLPNLSLSLTAQGVAWPHRIGDVFRAVQKYDCRGWLPTPAMPDPLDFTALGSSVPESSTAGCQSQEPECTEREAPDELKSKNRASKGVPVQDTGCELEDAGGAADKSSR